MAKGEKDLTDDEKSFYDNADTADGATIIALDDSSPTALRKVARAEKVEKLPKVVSCDNENCCNCVETENRKSELPTIRLLVTGICAVLGGGFHIGFQISLVSPLAVILQNFMVESLESQYDIVISEMYSRLLFSSVAGILFLGAIIGASLVPRIMAKSGSRWSFVYTTLAMVAGLFMASFSKNINSAEMFIIARLLVGICVGAATTIQGVFLTEISPLSCRGLMGTLAGLSTNIGFTVASALGLPTLFGSKEFWPLVFYLELIPCLIHLFMIVFFVVESPLHYLRSSDEEGARNALSLYHRNKASIGEELDRLRNELMCSSENLGWTTIWVDRAIRKALILSVLLNVAVSYSGVIATSFFGVFLLAGTGFTPYGAALANCFSSFSGTVGCLLSSFSIEKLGRRFLVIGSLLSLVAVNTGMMIVVWAFLTYNINWLGYAFLFLFNAFLLVFSVGIGPLAWFISTELTGPTCRARVQSLSVSAQYISCFFCPIIYFPLQKVTGPFSFLLFIIPLLIAALYMYIHLPETKDRSAQEVREMLENDCRK